MQCRRVALAGHTGIRAPQFGRWAFAVLALVASIAAGACGHMSTNSAEVQQPATQSKIVVVPNAIDFSNVVLGQKNSQTVRLTNTDSKRVHITGISITGAGLSVTSVTLPLSLDPQASDTFNVEFAPKSSGLISGKLTIESSVATETFNVQGSGAKAQAKLQTDPVSVDFGKIAVKKTTSRKVTLSNNGNSKITVSNVAIRGTGFSVTELPSKFALEPQQTISFQVSFHPQAKGTVNGSLSFTSKDLTSPLDLTLAGNGVDPGSVPASSGHTVSLDWDASPGNVAGYNVYRSIESGGPYDKLTSSPVGSPSYSDSDVVSGQTYYYAVTSVNHGGHESKRSDQVSVTIPNP